MDLGGYIATVMAGDATWILEWCGWEIDYLPQHPFLVPNFYNIIFFDPF